MARPRRDGAEPRQPRRRKLTELYVRSARAEASAFNTWDTHQRGLVLRVQPSGHRAWKAVYRRSGRPRWLHLGDARAIGLADARRLAARAMLKAAEGSDPVAEKRAERGAGTFAELAQRYLNEWAKKKNKSWRQADFLVRRYLLPRWGKLQAKNIVRSDVRAMMAKIAAPVLANQVLAAASAIFSWAIRMEVIAVNPCAKVDRNETRSRERILNDTEVAQFWSAFDAAGLVRSSALKTILLTGQRPGEVAHMRKEHVKDGWWEMPGEPIAKLGWPGLKNKQSHRVWLSAPVRAILAEVIDADDAATGYVFAGPRGKAVKLPAAMRAVCAQLGVNEKVTPHDLRRTNGSTITALGFGRDAMNRIQNHREGGIASVYDRHHYSEENRRIMETVASHILGLAEGRQDTGTVVQGRFNR
jgi:integrase